MQTQVSEICHKQISIDVKRLLDSYSVQNSKFPKNIKSNECNAYVLAN